MGKKRFGRSAALTTLVVVLLLAVTSTALAGTGKGGTFTLGVANAISGFVTTLKGAHTGRMLQVNNTATGATSGAVGANSAGATGATIRASNTGGGPALEAVVQPGVAPMRISAGAGKVRNLDADRLDGLDASQFQLDITGTCPAGASIGDIGQDGAVTCVEVAGNADRLDGHDANDFQRSYKRTVVVSPAGTDAENGAALRAALADLTASSAQPKLLRIEPGIYDVGTTALVMKPFVDVEGAGEDRTTITCQCAGTHFGNNHTLKGANDADLRRLTVQNSGGNVNSVGIYSPNVSYAMSHVTAVATGAVNENVPNSAGNTGIYNFGGAVEMRDTTARATGWPGATGVVNDNAPTLMHDVVVASHVPAPPPPEEGQPAWGGGSSLGVHNKQTHGVRMVGVSVRSTGGSSTGVMNGAANTLMQAVDALAQGSTASTGVFNEGASPRLSAVLARGTGGSEAYGIRNRATPDFPSSAPAFTAVSALASGASGSNYGMYNEAAGSRDAPSAKPVLTGVELRASGGTNSYGMYTVSSGTGSASPEVVGSVVGASGSSSDNVGINVQGAGRTDVFNSSVRGSDYSIRAWFTGVTTQVRSSSLAGPLHNDGTMTLDSSQIDGPIHNNFGSLRIGASMIGGAITNQSGGTTVCAASYDAFYAPLAC